MISQLWIIIAICAAIAIVFVIGATLLAIQYIRQQRRLEEEEKKRSKTNMTRR